MLDEIDIKILNILQEKARIPNVEVARQVGMAPSAVLERIRKLEKNGVIDGYEVRLNPLRFGRNLVAFVQVYPSGGFDDAAVGVQLAALSEVQEVHFVSGDDGFLLKLRVAGPEALGRLLRDKVAVIPGIRATRTTIVLASYKETAQIPVDPEAFHP
ncbi:MAG TPA: Lrp/AsnC family transcriptional regulator [Desulfobacterales bacterium]